ncbi:hypothetical protein M0802_003330 [Mischocyttarus mexicanus]|nr:hypothetical protein M0802_003330 [Mischocyttarus mexicanus]
MEMIVGRAVMSKVSSFREDDNYGLIETTYFYIPGESLKRKSDSIIILTAKFIAYATEEEVEEEEEEEVVVVVVEEEEVEVTLFRAS